MVESVKTLASGFLRSVERHPDRPALVVEGRVLSYRELGQKAASIAATLEAQDAADGPALGAVFAHRSATAYAAVLGTLSSGRGYVPLNRTFPPERTRSMLVRSRCRTLVVDTESLHQLPEVLRDVEHPLVIVAPGLEDPGEWRRRLPGHVVLGENNLVSSAPRRPREVEGDAIAYLLFTSGSTGTPKGVMVAHRNVVPFVEAMVERYGITEQDRFSQNFDLTFDLSVFDMFVAWERGACVCCTPQKALLNPGRFVRQQRLSVWFSVPSTGVFMHRLGALKPDSYPTLRWSLFCGEPLTATLAQAWAGAAPRSTLENLYGPTEVTIACTLYRWDPSRSPGECERGLVPIGDPLPGLQGLVVNDDLEEVEPGETGELLMAGHQVAPGYWEDPERTAQAFVVPPGHTQRHYRTGDLVRCPRGNAPMTYRGRRDHQIKIQGHRVELGEVEAVLREEAGIDAAVAVGWPLTDSGARGIVAFVADPAADEQTLREKLARRLPDYMVPRAIHLRETLPLNRNGKYDRNALVAVLKEMQ